MKGAVRAAHEPRLLVPLECTLTRGLCDASFQRWTHTLSCENSMPGAESAQAGGAELSITALAQQYIAPQLKSASPPTTAELEALQQELFGETAPPTPCPLALALPWRL